MGADLILASLAIRSEREPDWQGGYAWIRDTPAAELREAADHSYENSVGEPLDELTAHELRSWLRGRLDEVRAAIENGYRDVDWLSVDGYRLYVTGGMSWGDNPTESFQPFVDLANVPALCRSIGFEA
jgi:hypothetical protein